MRTKFSSLLLIFVALELESFSQKQVRVIPPPDKIGFTVESSTKDLGNRFFDRGVASPMSNHRGVVTTVDDNGKNVVLVWLFDHRGGYSLLMNDAETGKSEEFTIPFNPKQDTPYSSILSTSNKFYTHFSDHFTEFDPVKRAFTFTQKTMPQMAMAMKEDDKGKIWAITYPNSGLVSFDPKSRELKDYGYVYKENWRQYQRSLFADNVGWIYFGLGNASSQIIAFDPNTGKANGIHPQNERKLGTAAVYRDENGKVYGRALESIKDHWYELYKGEARKICEYNKLQPVKIITGSQSLFHGNFPDGTVLKELDLVNRILITENPKTNTPKEVSFDYTSDGAIVMGIGTAPDGAIVGGTAFPMRFFNYDLKKDRRVNRYALGQFNALVNQNKKVYFGVYSGGHLIEWDPYKPWVQTKLNDKSSNPLHITTVSPELIRPFRIIAHPDGKTIIMGGTPQYGATGGGLLLYDNQTKNIILLTDSMVVKDQSSISLVPLKNGKLLAGTTTTPGSGGEKRRKKLKCTSWTWPVKRLNGSKLYFREFRNTVRCV